MVNKLKGSLYSVEGFMDIIEDYGPLNKSGILSSIDPSTS